MSKRVLGLLFVFVLAWCVGGSVRAGVGLSMQEAGAYGHENFVLESDLIRVVVNHNQGGRVTELRLKGVPRNLTTWKNNRGGLMEDAAMELPFPSPFVHKRFELKLVKNTPEEVCLEVSHKAAGGVLAGVEIRKTYRLQAGRPYLGCTLEFINRGTASVKFRYRAHQCNWTQNKAEVLNLMPTRKGGIRQTDNPQGEQITSLKVPWEMTAGWMAALDSKSDTGLVSVFDYDELLNGFLWIGDLSTQEWYYRPLELAPGAPWSTDIRFVGVRGLSWIDHANDRAVVETRPENGGLTMALYGLVNQTIDVSAALLDAKTGKPTVQLDTRKVKLEAGKLTTVTWTVPKRQVTSAPLKVTLGEDSFQVVRHTTTDYRIPVPPRNPRPIEAPEVKTVEIPVHKRKPGGPVRVLVLTHDAFRFGSRYHNTRTMLDAPRDLARVLPHNRVQTTVAFSRKQVRGEPDFREVLPSLYSYDVLVLKEFPTSLIEPYVGQIEQYVERGGGLLVMGGLCAYGGYPADVQDRQLYKKDIGKAIYGTARGPLEKLLAVKIAESPDHQSKPARIETVKPNHPAVLLHPIDLKATYHKTESAEGATVLVRTDGGAPVLAVRELGEGRLASWTLSDFEREYLWDRRGEVYAGLLEWLASKDGSRVITSVSTGSSRNEVGKHRVSFTTSKPATVDVRLLGPAGRVLGYASAGAEPGKPVDVELTFAPTMPPGRYRVVVSGPDETAPVVTRFVDYTPSGVHTAQLLLPRSNYLRCEGLAVTFDPDSLGKALHGVGKLTCRARLVDQHGAVVRESVNFFDPSSKQNNPLSMPTDKLAYGRYTCTLQADRDGRPVAYGQHTVHLAAPADWQVKIGIFMGPQRAGHPVYLGAYEDLKRHHVNYVRFARVSSDARYSVKEQKKRLSKKQWGYGHFIPRWEQTDRATDDALRFGIAGPMWMRNATKYMGNGKPWYGWLSSPEKISTMRDNYITTIRRFGIYPAVRGIYFEDEADGAIGTLPFVSTHRGKKQNTEDPYHRRRFKEMFGYPMPVDTWTPKQALDVARYFSNEMNTLFREVRGVARSLRPEYEVVWNNNLLTEPPMKGTWPWEDQTWCDVYHMHKYANIPFIQDHMFIHCVCRTIGRYRNKPVLFLHGSYRNSFEEMKMQYWLGTAAGLDGFEWFIYSFLGMPGGSLVGTDKWEQILPHHDFSYRNAGLLSRLSYTPSKVAVLCSWATAAHKSYEQGKDKSRDYKAAPAFVDYIDRLEDLTRRLYEHDIMPDVIEERDIRAGRLANYEVVIVAGADYLEDDVIRTLGRWAADHRLYVDDATTVELAGARRLNDAKKVPFHLRDETATDKTDGSSLREIVKLVRPVVRETALDQFYVGPLCEGTLDYVAVYNHPMRPRRARIEYTGRKDVKAVYDMFVHRRLDFEKTDRGVVVHVPMQPAEGGMLAFLPFVIRGIAIDGPGRPMQAGSDLVFDIRLLTDAAATGQTPLQVKVIDPAGDETWYGKRMVLHDGRARFSLPTAVNDRRGRWRVEAIDQVTGSSVVHSFDLVN